MEELQMTSDFSVNMNEYLPLRDVVFNTLRQAILMAIDYDTICNSKTIGGLYTPGFSVLPSNLSYGYELSLIHI